MQMIAALGKSLYGEWWRNSVARDLEVHPCTIARWLRDIGAPAVDDVYRLMSVANARFMAIVVAHEPPAIGRAVFNTVTVTHSSPNAQQRQYAYLFNLYSASGALRLPPPAARANARQHLRPFSGQVEEDRQYWRKAKAIRDRNWQAKWRDNVFWGIWAYRPHVV
jgi:hypothetical protein